MCSPGSSGARNISTREQLRSNHRNTGTAVLPRRSILNETVGVRKNALAGDRSAYGYRPRHSDNGQPAQSRSRGAAVQAICWRRSRFWRRRFRTPWVGAGPWRFRGTRVRDEPSGFGHGRFETHCLRSGLPPERLLRVLVGDTGASAALAFAEHSHEHSASACNMRNCICCMGIGRYRRPVCTRDRPFTGPVRLQA
jgi:hypothetical protein